MKFKPIITSLLSTDIYKCNMCQIMFHKHTNLYGTYVFKCRNKGVIFTEEMLDEINAQIDHLCTLTYTKEELDYLRTIRYLKKDFIEALRLYRPLRDYVKTSLNERGELSIEITGPLWMASPFEIYLLEIVNEVYFRMKYNYQELWDSALLKASHKIEKFIHGDYDFNFAEFGCRRRLSGEWQEYVLQQMLKTGHCVGTPNIYLAMKYGLKPIGTYAHEYVQMFQGIEDIPVAQTNKVALKEWFEEYNGDNGTALTDTLTTDNFLLDFDKVHATMYSGVRHDSGDPYIWGDKIIAHYEKLGIDPKTKTLLFSDSLDFDKAQKIYEYFKGRCKVSFGIGTFITNDTFAEPLNIVIKLQYVNDRPVAKLSDVDGKAMCQDTEYLEYLRSAVKRRVNEAKRLTTTAVGA